MLIVSIEDADKEAKRIEDEAHNEKKARRNSRDDRSGKKEGVATVSEDKVREIVKQVVEEALAFNIDGINVEEALESWRDQLTKLRRDVDALELDVQELRAKQTPQQSDVAELALRILAAERGLIA